MKEPENTRQPAFLERMIDRAEDSGNPAHLQPIITIKKRHALHVSF
jgi:hypothetical protein